MTDTIPTKIIAEYSRSYYKIQANTKTWIDCLVSIQPNEVEYIRECKRQLMLIRNQCTVYLDELMDNKPKLGEMWYTVLRKNTTALRDTITERIRQV